MVDYEQRNAAMDSVRARRTRLTAIIAASVSGFVLLTLVGAGSAAASPARLDKWQSPAGTTKCRYVADGHGLHGRGTLECLVTQRGWLVRWNGRWSTAGVRITKATATQKARFAGARKATYRYFPSLTMGPRRNWGEWGSSGSPEPDGLASAYYCAVHRVYGSTCTTRDADDMVGINFRSGVVSIFVGGGANGTDSYTWTGSRWRFSST